MRYNIKGVPGDKLLRKEKLKSKVYLLKTGFALSLF
jgi:hypothetical protein